MDVGVGVEGTGVAVGAGRGVAVDVGTGVAVGVLLPQADTSVTASIRIRARDIQRMVFPFSFIEDPP